MDIEQGLAVRLHAVDAAAWLLRQWFDAFVDAATKIDEVPDSGTAL